MDFQILKVLLCVGCVMFLFCYHSNKISTIVIQLERRCRHCGCISTTKQKTTWLTCKVWRRVRPTGHTKKTLKTKQKQFTYYNKLQGNLISGDKLPSAFMFHFHSMNSGHLAGVFSSKVTFPTICFNEM